MARKSYRYSLARRDAKLVGVCSTLGERFNVDPTFLRIGFVAAAVFTSFMWTLAIYAMLGIYLTLERKREVERGCGASEFERMGDAGAIRPSIHTLRTRLEETDRRLMAIDHHIAKGNDDLAREIEALREEK
jgi:phage shock protein PspC (stress-responsive transcriptional regulator)